MVVSVFECIHVCLCMCICVFVCMQSVYVYVCVYVRTFGREAKDLESEKANQTALTTDRTN